MDGRGKKIRDLRARAGFTPAELGKKIGVSRISILKWESNDHMDIKADNRDRLAKVLKCKISDIFGASQSGFDNQINEMAPSDYHVDISRAQRDLRSFIDRHLPLIDDDLSSAIKTFISRAAPITKIQNNLDGLPKKHEDKRNRIGIDIEIMEVALNQVAKRFAEGGVEMSHKKFALLAFIAYDQMTTPPGTPPALSDVDRLLETVK